MTDTQLKIAKFLEALLKRRALLVSHYRVCLERFCEDRTLAEVADRNGLTRNEVRLIESALMRAYPEIRRMVARDSAMRRHPSYQG